MAGETSIDTGLNVGEAQVFRPYNDQGLTGQAAIGIEQDKIARKKAADDELKKKLAGSNLDMKGDGLPPALSPVWVKKYTELNKNIQQGILSGKENDIDFKNLTSRDIANVAQFVPDGKSMAVTLHELSKLNIAGELDPESQDSFNKLNDANYWSKRESEGASLPEIAGEYSALLQSVKKRPAVVDWNKELKLGTKGATKEVGRENEKTGFKTLTSVLDEKKAISEATGRWDALGAEKQLKFLHDFGVANSKEAIDKIYKDIVANTDTKDIQSYDKSGSTDSLGLGGGVKKINGILAKFNPVEFNGDKYAKIPKRGIGDQDKIKDNGDRTVGTVRLEHPDKGLSNKVNEFRTYYGNKIFGKVVGLDNITGRNVIVSYKDPENENEPTEITVPYTGNETQTVDFLNQTDFDTFFNKALENPDEVIEVTDTENIDNTPPSQKNKK